MVLVCVIIGVDDNDDAVEVDVGIVVEGDGCVVCASLVVVVVVLVVLTVVAVVFVVVGTTVVRRDVVGVVVAVVAKTNKLITFLSIDCKHYFLEYESISLFILFFLVTNKILYSLVQQL